MTELRYTLLTDGSSDRALIPLLNWLLHQHLPETAIQAVWADLRRLPRPPRTLPERIKWSLNLYPCDLLFVHRDAERVDHEVRVSEILEALGEVAREEVLPPAICVVPVRMQEAWLLFDEAALRTAAGNPRSRESLQLPKLGEIERVSDPKDMLHNLLRNASGLRGKRLKQIPVHTYTHRVAELIDDFSPLRVVPAFMALEQEVISVKDREGWI